MLDGAAAFAFPIWLFIWLHCVIIRCMSDVIGAPGLICVCIVAQLFIVAAMLPPLILIPGMPCIAVPGDWVDCATPGAAMVDASAIAANAVRNDFIGLLSPL